MASHLGSVIPAKAGIQALQTPAPRALGPRLRGGEDLVLLRTTR